MKTSDRTASTPSTPSQAPGSWLGNQAAFEVHAWTSRIDNPFRPTFALIDIDPGSKTTWEETLVLARLYRTALGHLGVRGYPKLTGQRVAITGSGRTDSGVHARGRTSIAQKLPTARPCTTIGTPTYAATPSERTVGTCWYTGCAAVSGMISGSVDCTA